ncbi:hypothetical protein [Sphingomonas sanxanigenens]|uniref:Uncharacterized protein n=1 Tax=Sphingomonas sanxanigenens DSM 19645 = NX02 TaxID=1123269 RepID=W0AAI4_9SPHN|nr:hypothetical protein [Sphingomonas sanxanigenens]AHE53338.1 hypothetical protein NX02_08070 [Sphingomonas sanxanigenens DSM 19645 = NX02]
MTVAAGESDHILRTWHEWEINGRERSVILVIETDAEMCAGEPGYDAMLLEQIRSAAVSRLNASATAIDRIRIVPVRY